MRQILECLVVIKTESEGHWTQKMPHRQIIQLYQHLMELDRGHIVGLYEIKQSHHIIALHERCADVTVGRCWNQLREGYHAGHEVQLVQECPFSSYCAPVIKGN